MKKLASIVLTGVLSVGFLFAAPASSVTVTWNVLKTLDKTKKNTPAEALNGKEVTIPGFMVPFEDDAENVSEFLLVPFAGACIHVPPPPPNQMIYVKLPKGKTTKFPWTDPISVTGKLHISTVDSPYGDVSYNMDGEVVAPYEE
ncbi:DUF3299 domain-containing protein [Edaphobacter sp. HDX4]|uniref:DUF3299 domain-containing protein n=1 Tax=Edaphobacter sp. HDX4 TaxID=2794064 RepID=UPI002FE514DB